MPAWIQKLSAQTNNFLSRKRKIDLTDLFAFITLAGIIYGLINLAQEWRGAHYPGVVISLSPWALPKYALFSLGRGICAYFISFGFTLIVGYWAAKDRWAERALIPLLDLLQSIPVLGFMPGLVLAFMHLFPSPQIGLEMAAILMIFTGQVWNMTFSFYHSVKGVPGSYRDAAKIYRFTPWQIFKRIELPYAAIGLVWNSMMSMAGGWFFLMISETFVLGNSNFQLPGIGSYMSRAVAEGNFNAMAWAIFTMILMIVILDQLLWRPIVVWSQKFKGDEGGEELMSSWFLNWLKQLSFVKRFKKRKKTKKQKKVFPSLLSSPPLNQKKHWTPWLSGVLFILLLAALSFGAFKLIHLLIQTPLHEWGRVTLASAFTLGRVITATLLGTLWTLPLGLAIGLSPKWSKVLEPIVQVTASFPAPMIYPLLILIFLKIGLPLGWGSIFLMLVGTQWYLLFNIIAGAMTIPGDLREAALSYRLSRWQTLKALWFPAVFPSLVTGWVTATGGAWNASVVTEYIYFRGSLLETRGLGALISQAASQANFPLLATCIMVMSIMVVFFNQIVWKRLYRLAEERFTLNI